MYNKLEALQESVMHLYPITLPYLTALAYYKLESLTCCRTEADEKFFCDIVKPNIIVCINSYLLFPDSQRTMRSCLLFVRIFICFSFVHRITQKVVDKF